MVKAEFSDKYEGRNFKWVGNQQELEFRVDTNARSCSGRLMYVGLRLYIVRLHLSKGYSQHFHFQVCTLEKLWGTCMRRQVQEDATI